MSKINRVLFLFLGIVLIFTGCQFQKKCEIPPYDISEFEWDKEYAEYLKDNISTLDGEFYQKRVNFDQLSFLIAENLMQTVFGKEIRCKTYYYFEKTYSDLDSCNICFYDKSLLQKEEYPCIEIEKATGKILRTYLVEVDSSKQEIKIDENFKKIESSEDEAVFQELQKKIMHLGKYTGNISYFSTTEKPWLDQVPITKDLLVLNTDDFMRIVFKKDYETLSDDMTYHFYIDKLKDKSICVISYQSYEFYQKIQIPYGLALDMETGEILGLVVQE